MSLVTMPTLLQHALHKGYAVGYFEAWDQYSLEAVLEAAEEAASPTILGYGGAITSARWLERRGVEEHTALARCLAERARVPVAIMFNEARNMTQLLRGLRAGCNTVMLDTSHLPYAENVALTRQVVAVAHPLGVAVEAELGHLADASDHATQGVCTDPGEAARFIASTGADALAVSIGNAHLLLDGESAADLDLLARLHAAVPVPLVIHGGSGFPAGAVRAAIARGVAKFNIGTRLKQVFLEELRAALAELPAKPNVQAVVGSREEGDVFSRAQARLKAEIIAYMKLYGCAGQATV
jgi:ketose-bisphosphate aldolase